MNAREQIQLPYSLISDLTPPPRRRPFNDITHYINRILRFKLSFSNMQTIYFEWSFEKWMNRILKKCLPKHRCHINRAVHFMFGTNAMNKCDAIVTSEITLRKIHKMCYFYDRSVPRDWTPVKYEIMRLTYTNISIYSSIHSFFFMLY